MRKQIVGSVVVLFLFVGLTAMVWAADQTGNQDLEPRRSEVKPPVKLLPVSDVLVIPAGDDFFETTQPSGFFLPIIEPGFFGSIGDGPSAAESDPIVGLPFIQVRGVPTGPLNLTASLFMPASGGDDDDECTGQHMDGNSGFAKHCIKAPDDELEEMKSMKKEAKKSSEG